MGDGVNPREIIRTEDDLSGTVADGRNGGRRMKGRLAGGVRDKLTMAEMKSRMASLWKDGVTYAEIANTVSDEFGLEGQQRFNANGIHYHIKNLLEYWRNTGLLHIDERQAMVLARYDQLEMLAMEAYFASCQGKLTKNYEKQVDRARSKDRDAMLREQIAEERERRKNELHGNQQDNPKFQFEFTDGDLPEVLMTTQEKIKEYSRHEQSLAGDPKWISIMVDINDKRAKLWGLLSRKGPDSDEQDRARLTDEQRDERLAAVISSALHRKAQGQDATNLAKPAPLGGFKEEDQPKPIEPEVLGPEEDEELGEAVEEFTFDEDFWK